MKTRAQTATQNLPRYIAAVIVAALFAIPLYVAIVNAFKTNAQITASPAAPPAPITLDNFIRVFKSPSGYFWQGLLTSLGIVLPALLGTIIFGSLIGYYLARATGWLPKLLLGLLLVGLMLPFQTLLLPLSIILKTFGLQGSAVGIILFNVAFYTPFAGFVYARFVQTVPIELEEAASLDGASPARTFVKVVAPLLRPTTASVLIFVGVWVWNDFLNPLVLLGPGGGKTVTTGLYFAIGQLNTDFGIIFALMILAAVPILVFFILMQKSFVAGLISGATKG